MLNGDACYENRITPSGLSLSQLAPLRIFISMDIRIHLTFTRAHTQRGGGVLRILRFPGCLTFTRATSTALIKTEHRALRLHETRRCNIVFCVSTCKRLFRSRSETKVIDWVSFMLELLRHLLLGAPEWAFLRLNFKYQSITNKEFSQSLSSSNFLFIYFAESNFKVGSNLPLQSPCSSPRD